MSKSTHHAAKKGGFPLFKLALGAALAAGAGYYATHKEEVDKEAKKRIQQLAKLFRENRPAVEKKVRAIWGKVSKEGVATYMDLRGQLLNALEKENLKKKGRVLKDHYDSIVKDVLGRARKSRLLTPQVEARMSEIFKMDWKQISGVLVDLLSAGAKKTVSAIKKKKQTVRRGVKTARKTVKRSTPKSAKKPAAKPAKRAKTKKAGKK